MQFVEAVDYGDAKERFISGVAQIEQIGPGTVRISFYSATAAPDGGTENRIVHHQVWDLRDWLLNVSRFRQGREMIEATANASGNDRRYSVDIHH